jgi:ubiquinone/menaquinone biosynthesis C-methylase UbiE
MNNQKGSINLFSGKPTAFAEEVIKTINPSSKILELGCGAGNDSVGFAQAGHTVIATDFSEVAIKRNSESFKDFAALSFEVLDISEPMRFHNGEFDVVYARLSLHYFTDKVTRKICSEIHRVLKPDGYLCFICKSTQDPLYGKGIEIEKDMYELNGHIRHFFNEEYTKSLLRDKFAIVKIKSGVEQFYGCDSAFIKVIARATK